MTALVLNQQIKTMEKKVLNFKKVFFYLLPFAAAAVAYSLGYESVVLPVFILFFFISVTLELSASQKGEAAHCDETFFKNLEEKKPFDIDEAKKLLKKHNAVIYRIDGKNHTIQFFVDKTKYTMHIKNKQT